MGGGKEGGFQNFVLQIPQNDETAMNRSMESKKSHPIPVTPYAKFLHEKIKIHCKYLRIIVVLLIRKLVKDVII